MRLLEVFKDFEVIVNGASQFGRYRATFKVVPKNKPKRLTQKDLEKYIKKLQERYPKRNFKLRKYKNFLVISQKTTYVDKKTQREINTLKARLRNINRRLLQSAVDRYEKIVITQQLKKLKRKVKKKKDVVPIYVDLKKQRFFVPESYVKNNPKLVNYICMVTLGSLGVSQSKYVRSG